MRDTLHASPRADLRAATGQYSHVCDEFELLVVQTHSRPTQATGGVPTVHRRPPHIFRRHPATLPTPCTHTAVPRRPRRRPRSVHDSPRRTPVPQASHTAPAPEPSQRETPVRRNDARLVAAPRCSDLPAPPAAPLHASMQVYQSTHARVYVRRWPPALPAAPVPNFLAGALCSPCPCAAAHCTRV